ncbi:GDSL-type esterase/lipase family protein [Microbispora sp. H10836]|uniref:GDSL-type esterase/lipase family protein n=1 Tax=Microbispora sp. H10836 TaxID=2729106 RepID=UPI00147581CF|nr:GDSL-type esterase/lipase family protein [Microbispora sp. H10836]
MHKTSGLALLSRHVQIVVLSIAMLVCLAPVTPARAAARDVTITLNASDLGVNPAVLRDIVPEMQAEITEHGGLGDTLKQAIADSQSPVSITVDTSVWPNFSGTVNVTSNGAGLVLTIPAAEITTSGFWQQVAATAIAWIVGYGLRMLCIGSLTASGVLAATVPLVCTPLQTTVTGIMAALVTHAFAGDLGTPEATRDIIIAGILGLAGGFLWEKYLAPWAKANLADAIKRAGIWIRSQVPWLDSWFGGVVAGRVEQLGWRFQELEALIAEETAAWAGVTSNLQRDLRIMALGDSITYGAGSSNGGGYRSTLSNMLREDGATVTFVGSQHSGPAPDAHEGRSGWTISQIAGITDSAMATYRPNVVLLHIGTNDMNNNDNPDGAPARLGSLIDQIFRADPNVTLLVSTIVPSNWGATQARILRFNEAIRSETGSRWAAGKHVYMVNMSPVTLTDLADLLHPNDSGYLKMAALFYRGLVDVGRAGWIAGPGGGTPAAGPVKGWFPQGTIASGTFTDFNRRVVYADINGDRKADYLEIDDDSSVRAWLNGGAKPGGGDWYWWPQGTIAGGVGAIGIHVHFTDINADGRADYLVVGYDGSVRAWLNGGAKPGGGDWYWWPQGTVAGGVGAPASHVQFADLDGDGRADYLKVNDDSSVQAWLNGGPKPSGGDWYWWPQGTIAGGVGAPGSRIRFAPLYGTRSADYVRMGGLSDPGTAGYDSSVQVWQNGGPKPSGGDWYWIPGGQVASGVGVDGRQIQLADLDGDGRADYLDVDPRTGATRAWTNFG